MSVRDSRIDRPIGEHCESEVGDARLAVRSEEHVGWLDIPVDDPMTVRVLQSQGQRPHQLQDRLRRGLAIRVGPILQRTPFQILHRQERGDVVDIVVEELAQVLVVQPLDGLDFDAKAIGDLGHPMAQFERDLERNLPVKPVVPGAEDLAHPTAADPLQYMIPDRPVELGGTEGCDRIERLAACRADAVDPEPVTVNLDVPAAPGIRTSHAELHRVKPGRVAQGSLVDSGSFVRQSFSGK